MPRYIEIFSKEINPLLLRYTLLFLSLLLLRNGFFTFLLPHRYAFSLLYPLLLRYTFYSSIYDFAATPFNISINYTSDTAFNVLKCFLFKLSSQSFLSNHHLQIISTLYGTFLFIFVFFLEMPIQ